MARFKDMEKLLQILAETPVVSFACKKIGLDRTTFYRWHKDNIHFREKVDNILRIGRMNINDMAEASVIKEINDGNMRANIFWLQYNHPTYRPVRTAYVDPMSNHRHELVPGETCGMCGFREPIVEEYNKKKTHVHDNKVLARELFKRIRFVGKDKQSEEDIRKMIDDFVQSNNMTTTVRFEDFSEPKNDETDPSPAQL